MISDEVMDKIIRVRSEEEEIEELIAKLQERDFVVTNISKGGVFYTLLWVCVHVGVQLKSLAVDIINSAFMRHCPDDWVEIRAADYSKYRKEGDKAEGYLTIKRADGCRAFRIRSGHPFRTLPDAYGTYLRYYALEDTVLPAGETTSKVKVQAEEIGQVYNVAPGMITHTMVHIDDLDSITNETGWLTTEGSPEEDTESLRARCINGRAENAERNIDRKIKSIVENVKGVKVAHIDSQHPRGQGTCDIIVTSTTGQADSKLLDEVRKAIDPITGTVGDYLVKSSTVQQIDVKLTLFIAKGVSTEGYAAKAETVIRKLMDVGERDELNTLYLDSIKGAMMMQFDKFRRCDVISPAQDIVKAADVVLVARSVQVEVKNVS